MDAAVHKLQDILKRMEEASKASLLQARSGDRASLEPVSMCESVGEHRNKTKLLAVSKTHNADAIEPVIKAGQLYFGENRVQEAKQKWPEIIKKYEMIARSGGRASLEQSPCASQQASAGEIKSHRSGDRASLEPCSIAKSGDFAGSKIKLHLIGPLQSNKAKEAAQFFDVIESVDRPKLAHALAAIWPMLDKKPELYIQINTGCEQQKAGVMPQDATCLLKLMRDELGLPVDGVMCIPPADAPPEPHFAWLYNFAAKNNIREISMGMSHDFEAAVRFGATQVRVGSALFGGRG